MLVHLQPHFSIKIWQPLVFVHCQGIVLVQLSSLVRFVNQQGSTPPVAQILMVIAHWHLVGLQVAHVQTVHISVIKLVFKVVVVKLLHQRVNLVDTQLKKIQILVHHVFALLLVLVNYYFFHILFCTNYFIITLLSSDIFV